MFDFATLKSSWFLSILGKLVDHSECLLVQFLHRFVIRDSHWCRDQEWGWGRQLERIDVKLERYGRDRRRFFEVDCLCPLCRWSHWYMCLRKWVERGEMERRQRDHLNLLPAGRLHPPLPLSQGVAEQVACQG